MTYKILNTSAEYKGAEELCIEHNASIPNDGLTMIGVDDTGKVVGAISLRSVFFIEPLVSNNPIVATELFKRMEGVVLAKGANILRCITKEENENRFSKAGFIKVFNNQIVMEKLYI